MKYLLNVLKQLRHQIHVAKKGRSNFYQDLLQVILRNIISKKKYTLQINSKLLVRATNCNIYQPIKAEISAVIDHWLTFILSAVYTKAWDPRFICSYKFDSFYIEEIYQINKIVITRVYRDIPKDRWLSFSLVVISMQNFENANVLSI